MIFDEIIELLKREQDELYDEAFELAQTFWAEHFRKKKFGRNGWYGIRVRKRTIGISATWFRRAFFKLPDGETKRTDVFISCGSGYSYPPTKFRKMKDWEREKALEIEKYMQYMRKRSRRLATIKKTLLAYEKLKRDTAYQWDDDDDDADE